LRSSQKIKTELEAGTPAAHQQEDITPARGLLQLNIDVLL
jgi:hypothetical protein